MGRWPCVRQSDSSDCGPAVLATLARSHGIYLSLARARELVGMERIGTDIARIADAAERLGFQANYGEAEANVLERIPLPAIAHLKEPAEGHFVVLHQVSGDSVVVADPAGGTARWKREEFERRWSGILLVAAPGPDFRKRSPEERPTRLLFRLARQHLNLLLRTVALTAFLSLFGLALSFFVQLIVDRIVPYRQFDLLKLVAAATVFLILVRAAYAFLREYWMAHVGRRFDVEVTSSLLRTFLRMPIRFFDVRTLGDVTQRLGDVSGVRSVVISMTVNLIADVGTLIFFYGVMMLYHPGLTLLVTVLLPVIAVVPMILRRPLQKIQGELFRLSAEGSAGVIDTFGSIRLIKGFGAESLAHARLAKNTAWMAQARYRQSLWMTASGVLTSAVSTLLSAVVLWLGAGAVLQGSLTLGQLMFFNASLAMLLGPVERLSSASVAVIGGLVSAERLADVFSTDPEDSREGAKVTLPECRGKIEFEDVDFSYRKDAPVLRGIRLSIEPGTTLALVGETGSGKTTLASLIAGFYTPDKGRVLIDGISLRSLDKSSYRRHLGVVFQDNFLLNATIRENLALGKPDASLEQIRAAVRAAQADDFIHKLPGQYDCAVGERGVLLSSGQRQRIAIARAILRNPAVMILDEATNNLDSETEQAILGGLWDARRGRTTVVIAHRLSTVMRADRIVVLQDGRIVEQGTHRELMSREGRYYSLWMRQAPMLAGERT